MTGQQIVVYEMLFPSEPVAGIHGDGWKVYLYGAALLGAIYSSIRAAISKSRQSARQPLLASVIYLPLLFILMVLNR